MNWGLKIVVAMLCTCSCFAVTNPSHAGERPNALVVAVDTSSSTNMREAQGFQRAALTALRNQGVLHAIRHCFDQVSVVAWSSGRTPVWSVISKPSSCIGDG